MRRNLDLGERGTLPKYIMKWEKPSSETCEKFKMLVRFIANLTGLANNNSFIKHFNWKFANGKLYANGAPRELVKLYNLIWYLQENYSRCYRHIDGETYVEVTCIS